MYLQNICIDSIVNQLYDLEKPGAIGFSGALTGRAQEELSVGMKLGRYLMKPVKRNVGEVVQEMETAYLERMGDRIYEVPLLARALDVLQQEYHPIHEAIGRKAGFTRAFNSLGLHFYKAKSAGITPHQDYARDVDIIASVVVEGRAVFGVCKNRKKENPQVIAYEPGSIIFMRAARNPKEQMYRPFHFVESPEDDRYSILIRTRSDPLLDN